MNTNYDLLIIGGGAAGFFMAINAADKNRDLKIAILERSRDVLQKVKVSGGGRCNVTHACFEAEELVKFYPRGKNELLEPFQKFNPTHTIEWFNRRGVEIKKETDGRMFPVTDSSQTIIDCFLEEIYKLKIDVIKNCRVQDIDYQQLVWKINASDERVFETKNLMIATGSDTAIWKLLEKLDIKTISPVPSLFTFNIKDERIKELMGLSVPNSELRIKNYELGINTIGNLVASANRINIQHSILKTNGAVLITHWGLSGPAVLKLSAWAARELNEANYHFSISVNWLNISKVACEKQLLALINSQPKKNVIANNELGIPIRLWKNLCKAAEISEFQKWAETGKKHIAKLADQLTNCVFEVTGKSTFKEEFVTAGGVDLSEIDFTTFSSKKYPTLFFAGEVLNIDAITGGFNFQAAWTGAYLAAVSVRN